MNSPTHTDSLHPLEIQVLRVLGKHSKPPTDPQLVHDTVLAPSQVSMALGWLLTKELVTLTSETTTTHVSLTDVGRKIPERSLPP